MPLDPPFNTAKRRVHRKREQVAATSPPPPPPPHALMIAAWLEDELTLNVQFDREVTVVAPFDIGTWKITDVAEGEFNPWMLIQTDVDSIWLMTSQPMTAGTAGYNAENPGGLSSADGFPDSDVHGY